MKVDIDKLILWLKANYEHIDESKPMTFTLDMIKSAAEVMEQENPTPKLKPCPFCGNMDIHITDAWPHYPYCLECGAQINAPPYDFGDTGIKDAAKRWNRRTYNV